MAFLFPEIAIDPSEKIIRFYRQPYAKRFVYITETKKKQVHEKTLHHLNVHT